MKRIIVELLVIVGSILGWGGAMICAAGQNQDWNADVKKVYQDILASPGTDWDEVKAAVRKLSGLGVAAEPAIAALAQDASLQEPQWGMGGIMLARFHRFDLKNLRLFLKAENPYLALESAKLLAVRRQMDSDTPADFLSYGFLLS
jgi:hypothetical protein